MDLTPSGDVIGKSPAHCLLVKPIPEDFPYQHAQDFPLIPFEISSPL